MAGIKQVKDVADLGAKGFRAIYDFVQQSLPGVKQLSGVTPVPGKPGMYMVEPAKVGRGDRGWINRTLKELEDESTLAGKNSMPADMLMRVIETIKGGTLLPGLGKSVRGVVQVAPSGKVVGGAAVDLEKAAGKLNELDFTKPPAQYLEYVSAVSPEAKGSDMVRILQDKFGDDLVFQVANPKQNVPIYERWGAQRMPLTSTGEDVLGGRDMLPAYRITDRIPEEFPIPQDPRQMRLEGFANGGSVLDQQPSWGDAISEVAGDALNNVSLADLASMLMPLTPASVGAQLLTHSPEAAGAGVAPPTSLMNKLQQVIARQKGAARQATNASNPAWLLSGMSGRHMAAKTPEEAAAIAQDLQKAREWYDRTGYLTPETANKLMRSMNRSPLPSPSTAQQLGLGFAYGGRVTCADLRGKLNK